MVYKIKQEQYKRSSQSYELGFLPSSDPTIPTTKSIVTRPKKMAKVQGDRTLRVDEWAGGYNLQGQKAKNRTWKVKAHVPKHFYEDNYLFQSGME